jgi:hypothetical protein
MDAELFANIGKWALSAAVHEQVGMAVTGEDGDTWLINVKNNKPVGFAQLRLMKNGHAHMRYLFSDSLAAKLELGHAAIKKAKELGAECVYTNERKDSPVMPSLDFVKAREATNSRFARWERKVA